ncbi:MAG: DUF2285 domain-containing protein [Pseudomonadales bacterium]|jgi:hypothetical protein|nr:DUF2285 domain-containing protein [Pseudomonadales bacterium]
MADRSAEHWYPTAAYLYVLYLDGPALAWEYLRRNPDYRLDWLRRHRRSDAAQSWGLRLWEDPSRDARDAHPAWFLDHDSVIQLYPDASPPPDAKTFDFWRIPGRKHLIHDGRRLILVAHWPGHCARFALADNLVDGMAFVYAVRVGAAPHARSRAPDMPAFTATATPAAMARGRPTPAALLELHTVQALDATLAGASLREIAEGLFGSDAVAGWYADGGLRSRVRRLAQRGQSLMRGGYRRLAQIE